MHTVHLSVVTHIVFSTPACIFANFSRVLTPMTWPHHLTLHALDVHTAASHVRFLNMSMMASSIAVMLNRFQSGVKLTVTDAVALAYGLIFASFLFDMFA